MFGQKVAKLIKVPGEIRSVEVGLESVCKRASERDGVRPEGAFASEVSEVPVTLSSGVGCSQ